MVLGGVVLGFVVDLALTMGEVEGAAEVEGVVFWVKDRVVVLGFVVEGLEDVLDTGVAVVVPAAVVSALVVVSPP